MESIKRITAILLSVLLIAAASATAMAETSFSDGSFEFVKTDKNNGLITACELTERDITIPEFVLYYPIAGIGNYAFMSTPTLRSVTMPLAIASIGEYAFADNPQLFTVKIPMYCDAISSTAFAGSPNAIIVCNEGSYAAQYAEENGVDCIVIESFVLGDVNADSKLTVRDVTCIQLFLAEEPYYAFNNIQSAAADVDGNGVVNINDATCIQLFKVGRIAGFDNQFYTDIWGSSM